MSIPLRGRGLTAAAVCAVFCFAAAPVFSDDAAAAGADASDASGSFFDFGTPSDGGSPSEAGAPSPSSALTIGGSVSLDARAYLDDDAVDAVSHDGDAADATETVPALKLDLTYKGASTEFVANLKVNETIVEDTPEDVLQEAYIRAYAGDFILETGKMKLVWGKGDELHVVDLFNANDYTDFIFPDYADRRLAEPMVHLAWNSASGLRAEAVWTPTMTADRIPTSGYWAPAEALALKSVMESYVGYLAVQQYATTYQSVYASTYQSYLSAGASAVSAASVAQTTAAGAASAASTELLSDYADGSKLLPDTNQLDYGQYGFRLTGTAGSLDWGASYYLGHFKTPSVAATYNATGTTVTDMETAYDRIQSFGLESGLVAGPFNFRAEAAYYLTDDVDGDDPAVKNNSLNWVFGFDVGLPLDNLSINIQTIGEYILNSDDVDSYSGDVDYDADGIYTNNKLVVRLADNWLREKLQGEVKVIWGIERGDVVVNPSLEWNAVDDLFLMISGAFFPGADDGEFSAFSDNRYVKLSATYKF